METPTKIEVDQGLTLTWEDGSTGTISPEQLRSACLCADCRSDDGARRKQLVVDGAVPITIDNVQLVGAYAINVLFGPDGHSTGIFSFDQLREVAGEGAV